MQPPSHGSPVEPPKETRDFYVHALAVLGQCGAPYAVGGGYAMAHYTGIVRHTKDLDIFIRRQDRERVLDAFVIAGYRTELTWPHFLVKALREGGDFVDFLYNSGNGLCPVDDDWFRHSERAEVWGRTAPICPPEETLWMKAFVRDRDRFDGADVAHLILARGASFDWHRLLKRFAGHEAVLLGHLMFYGYSYPGHRGVIPDGVLDELFAAARRDSGTDEHLCRGTNLSRKEYLHDVEAGGFVDVRLRPVGPMTADEIRHFNKH